jgi:hypothetical protein
MPPVTPNYDLGLLITIDISIGLLTVLAIMIGVWGIMRQNLRSQERVPSQGSGITSAPCSQNRT